MTTLPTDPRADSPAPAEQTATAGRLSSGLMREGPFSSRQRALVRTAQSLCAERAAQELSTKQRFEATTAEAERVWAEAVSRADEAASEAHTIASAEHEADSTRMLDAARTGLEDATRTRDRSEAITRERADLDLAASKTRLQESLWMTETLFDSSKDKPRIAFEQTDSTIKGLEGQSAGLETIGTLLIKRCGAAIPLVVPRVPTGETTATDTQAAPLVAALREQLATATGLADRLDRLFLGRVVVGAGPWLLTAAAGLAGGLGLPATLHNWTAAVIGAGAAGAAVLAGAGVMGLQVVLRKQASGLAGPLFSSLDVARITAAAARAAATQQRRTQEAAILERRERETRDARTTHDDTTAELRTIHTQRVAEARALAQSLITQISASRDQQLAEMKSNHDAAHADADGRLAAARGHADESRSAALAQAQAQRYASWNALAAAWKNGLTKVYADVAEQDRAALSVARPWSDDPAAGWREPEQGPPIIPLGRANVELASLPGGLPDDPRLHVDGPSSLSLPVVLELPDHASLLVQHAGPEGRPAAIAALQNAMLRLLTTIPPAKARFTLLDPVGLGQSFAAFMHLADYEPLLVADRIWTEPKHIEQKLTDLTEHMENVIQKYLRNQFASIEDYNRDAGEIAEPYRFLVLADFPAGFNENCAKRLASILSSGPRCGVYTLIARDTRQPLPQGLAPADLEIAASVRLVYRLAADGRGALARADAELAAFPLSIDAPPADAAFNQLVHRVGAASKDAGRVRVPFGTIAPGEGEMWTRDSGRDVAVSMGRAGATRLQSITLGRGTAQHALIAGRTGSGKSTLLHAIITNLALWYSPSQVEFYLIDFKKGVEFKTYAASGLPHARVVAVESEREFGLSVLRRLDGELKRRGELFREVGVQDLAGFRTARPGERMPRTLLLVDEFQELFVEDDKLAQEAGLLLDRLVRQGRAFGMHIVLGSQTLGGAYSLARSTIGQMAVRIALQCSEADSYLIMSDDNSAARLLTRPGEAIYNDQSGAVAGNSPFQVAWLPDEQRDEYLARVVAESQRTGNTPPEPMIVFEGNAPANLATNQLLAAAIERRVLPAAPSAWLGEPIAIKDPTAAVFRRQSGANLLVVGQREDSALALTIGSILALAAQQPRGHRTAGPTPVTILDGTPADAPTAGTLDRLSAMLPGLARSVPYRDAADAVATLVAELDRRMQAESAGSTTTAAPCFLVIHGLHRYRVLRRPENEFDFSGSGDGAPAPDKLLARLLREGPALGLHVVAWCDNVANLQRTLDRQTQREFDLRVLFQMSQADSAALIDAPIAGLIGQNRALFASEEQGLVEKFRPYAPPDPEWLAQAAAAITRA